MPGDGASTSRRSRTKDEKGFRDGVDLTDVNNKSVLEYIEEEARKRGGYEPLRKLVERLGDDAGDRAYRALLYTYRRTPRSVGAAR